MKIIQFAKYKNLQNKLFEYINTHEDPYGYIFHAVNGYPFGDGGSHRKERLLRMAHIKKLWDSHYLCREIVRLVIFCHYRWQIIETSPTESRLIYPDMLNHFADQLRRTV